MLFTGYATTPNNNHGEVRNIFLFQFLHDARQCRSHFVYDLQARIKKARLAATPALQLILLTNAVEGTVASDRSLYCFFAAACLPYRGDEPSLRGRVGHLSVHKPHLPELQKFYEPY